jgi:hypothetical protein
VWKDQEDELANQFNATMNISTKRRRIHEEEDTCMSCVI